MSVKKEKLESSKAIKRKIKINKINLPSFFLSSVISKNMRVEYEGWRNKLSKDGEALERDLR